MYACVCVRYDAKPWDEVGHGALNASQCTEMQPGAGLQGRVRVRKGWGWPRLELPIGATFSLPLWGQPSGL